MSLRFLIINGINVCIASFLISQGWFASAALVVGFAAISACGYIVEAIKKGNKKNESNESK